MAATPKSVTLPKAIFAVDVKNHELVKLAYDSYLASARLSSARTKQRGEVRGGGKKPWAQKGTGRARFGSSRNPIWRGGGIVFGPRGNENYSKKISTSSKRVALRQALTLAHQAKKIQTVNAFTAMNGKTKDMAAFLDKVGATRYILCVVAKRDYAGERATRNIPQLKVSGAMYLNVFDILNADTIIMSSDAVVTIETWLSNGEKK